MLSGGSQMGFSDRISSSTHHPSKSHIKRVPSFRGLEKPTLSKNSPIKYFQKHEISNLNETAQKNKNIDKESVCAKCFKLVFWSSDRLIF